MQFTKKSSLRLVKTLVCLAPFALGIQLANADTLHGFCVSPAPTCSDIGITPTSTNPPDFGFGSSGTTTGNFELLLLVPDNEDPTPAAYSLTVNGTNVTDTPVSSTLFSSTEFTGGGGTKLEDYLGVSYTPSNPLSAFLPYTQTVDPGATGYFVYLFDFGVETGDPKNDSTAPTFNVKSGTVDVGSVFLGLEFTGDNVLKGSIFGDTPSSAAILEGGSSVPEPTSLGLVCGVGMIGLAIFRRRFLAAPK